MSNVVPLKGEAAVQGSEAVAKVVAWLRAQADELESGEVKSAHKAVLVTFEDRNGEIETNVAFCNITTIERIGLMYVALNDTTNAD